MLCNINSEVQLSKQQEQLFRNLVDHKEQTVERNIIEAKKSRGPRKKLLLKGMPRLESDICAASSTHKRSKSHEEFEVINSSTGLS